ncbi:MAG: DUF6273 domain-containing protein [Oscillospiraceae bacterium]|nr:DUF6273 domain-containing protein [Oscillospiraceae bacterium]
MKCNKCNAEWQVDASRSASITVCPFCKKRLVTKKSSGWTIDAPAGNPSPSDNIGKLMTLGGIGWRVIDVENNRALLISEEILEERPCPYNVEFVPTTWEDCMLRKYLNGEFYNSLGTDKSKIAETRINNSSNPWYGTDCGSATIDKVFLLSLEELVKYFGDSGDLRNKKRYGYYGENSKYVLEQDGNYLHDQFDNARIAKDKSGNASCWWLRSPGDFGDSATAINLDGSVSIDGHDVTDVHCGVRPALWLNL